MDGHPQFPATSLSRSAGHRLQASTTQELHPLSSSPPASDIAGINSAQKYKPYTPRTRVVPATTTNTLVHPPSPLPVAGEDATSKLQLTKAKSEAQNLGLDTSSIGWAIVEKVVAESETGELWADIWSSITSGQATILLPTEPLSTHDKLTPEFLKDHIAYCDAPSNDQARKTTPIVTLSGLRGTIHGTRLTFSTTLHPLSASFQSLRDPVTRSSALNKLPSLPSATTSLETSAYPEFTVLNGLTTLPLPPRAPIHSKPPLPPRPGARPLVGSPTPSAPTSSSRIPNPFASLFGGGGHRHSTSTSSTSGVFSSPSPSIRSNDLLPITPAADAVSQTVEISAIIIDKKLDRKAIGKMMNEALSKEIKAMLSAQDVPRWVALRVAEFCQPWFPFIRAPKIISASLSKSAKQAKEDKDKDATTLPEWNVNPDRTDGEALIEDKMDFVQEFYMQLEEGLRVDLGWNDEGGVSQNGDVEKEGMEKMGQSATRVRNIMELVERTICSLFYDRLFMQPQSDDAQHDTALSNRVAALNLLDLTLEHLDIEISETRSIPKINNIVRACGQRLSDLDGVRAPKDKARILVDAHQIVVDGLSKLPPIRLMSAEESKALRERLQQQAAAAAVANAKENNNVKPPVGPQVLLTMSSPKGHAIAATSATSTPTTTTAESTTTLLVSAEGGIPSPTSRNAEMPHGAELSPLSFATKETLSSESPSRSSSPAIPESATTSNSGEDESQKKNQDRNPKPTPVSSDILLPMIIFSVVKSNPPHLVSNLLYTQRFRNQSAFMQEGSGGESFCLINLVAVAEFLENVDLEGLGLGSATDTSATELSPIIARAPTPFAIAAASAPTTPKSIASGTPLISGIDLRGKVESRVDAIAGSANKVFSGVVDSSFGILKSLLPHQQNEGGGAVDSVTATATTGLDGKSMMVGGDGLGVGVGAGAGGVVETPAMAKQGQGQGFGLLRRETSGFSIASIISRTRVQQQGEDGQQLMDVGSSRPGSLRSFRDEGSEDESEDEDDEEDIEGGEEEGEEDSDEDSDDGEEGDGGEEDNADMRSDYSAREFGESEDDENRTRTGINVPGIQITSKSSSPYMSKGPSQSASSFGTDTRSIRSFESMMSEGKKRQQQKKMKMKKKIKQKVKKANERERKEREKVEREWKGNGGKDVGSGREPRKSISDRLASVSALVGGLSKVSSSPPGSHRSSLLQPPSNIVAPIPVHARLSISPSSSRAPSPSATSRSPSPLLKTLPATNMTTAPITRVREPSAEFPLPLPVPRSSTLPTPSTITSQSQNNQSRALPQPNRRFMECASVEELRIGEVGELLEEYRKLVEGVRSLGLI